MCVHGGAARGATTQIKEEPNKASHIKLGIALMADFPKALVAMNALNRTAPWRGVLERLSRALAVETLTELSTLDCLPIDTSMPLIRPHQAALTCLKLQVWVGRG